MNTLNSLSTVALHRISNLFKDIQTCSKIFKDNFLRPLLHPGRRSAGQARGETVDFGAWTYSRLFAVIRGQKNENPPAADAPHGSCCSEAD